jgi:hypothetical protein
MDSTIAEARKVYKLVTSNINNTDIKMALVVWCISCLDYVFDAQ